VELSFFVRRHWALPSGVVFETVCEKALTLINTGSLTDPKQVLKLAVFHPPASKNSVYRFIYVLVLTAIGAYRCYGNGQMGKSVLPSILSLAVLVHYRCH